jgi:hypothetical protein
MKRTWFYWAGRIGLGFLALFAVLCAGGFIWNPEATALLVTVLLQPVLSNTQPPPIAEGQTATEQLTRIFGRKFPPGSKESALRMTLLSQGFKSPPAPSEQCVPAGRPTPVNRVFYRCPTYDPSKTLEYQWNNFPCGETILVLWSAGENGAITQIKGEYTRACL